MSGETKSIALTFPFALGVAGGGTHDFIRTAIGLAACGARVAALPVQTSSHDFFPRLELPADQAGAERRRELVAAGVDVVPVDPHPLHFLLDAANVRKRLQALLEGCEIDTAISYWQEGMGLSRFARENGLRHGIIAAASYRQWLFGSAVGPETARGARLLVKRHFVEPLRRHVRGPLHRFRAQRIVGDALRSADFIIARSRFTQRELVELFSVDEAKISVAYCGVDEAFMTTNVHRDAAGDRRLLYVGALVAKKGIFDALDALSLVAKEREFELRVAGLGDASRVQRYAAALGISDRVHLLGNLQRTALIEQLGWADLGIMPSYSESFGLAVAEAQAAGLPVVAYRAGAVPEVVEDAVTGLLARPGDVADLARQIGSALESPETLRRMGEAARKRAARFSWERSAQQVLCARQSVG